nr:hypothetical protein [Tanacetum cinerariifolium]
LLIHTVRLVPTGSGTISAGRYSFILLDWFLLVVFLVHADEFVPAGRCTITTALLYMDDHNKVAYLEKGKGWEAYEQILNFLNRSHIGYALTHRPTIVFDSLVTQFWATATVRTLEAGPSDIIATIDGNEVVVTESLIRTQLQLDDVNGLYEFTLHDVLDEMRAIGYPTDGSLTFYKAKLSPQWRPTFDFTTKLFSNMKLNWDGPHMPLLAPMLVVLAARDGADAVAAGAAAAHEVSPPPIVPHTHSTPGPSSALQITPVREPTLVRDPTPVRDPTLVRDPTPVRKPTPSLVREPTPDSPKPFSPPPRTEEVGPTTSTRSPSPTRHTSAHEAISEGGGDFVSSPQCLNRVTTLENELGNTKKRLVLFDSEGEDTTPTEQDINLEGLHTLARTSLGGDSSDTPAGHDAAEVPADTSMPSCNPSTTRRRLRKPFSSSASAHISENIPAGASVPVAATTIPTGSFVDAAIRAAAAPSFSIPTAADKGKSPMVDDSLPANLLSEQERVLKNLHDSQLGEELAKKIHAEQEAEFAKQQEELAQNAHAECVASPTEHGTGMFDQRRRELDDAQLIYTEADWLELLAKIATNSALSKQLLGDDVTEENMNERLGMLLLRKRRELVTQSRVKPMTKTQQRDYMRDCKIHVKYRSFHSIRAESPYDTKWAKMAQGKNGLHKSPSKAGPPYGDFRCDLYPTSYVFVKTTYPSIGIKIHGV